MGDYSLVRLNVRVKRYRSCGSDLRMTEGMRSSVVWIKIEAKNERVVADFDHDGR